MTLKKYLSLTFAFSIYCLLPLNQLKAGVQLSSEFLDNETLDQLCTTGSMYNSFGGGVGGYMENIFRSRLTLGKMTGKDFTKLQRWFYSEFPSGW